MIYSEIFKLKKMLEEAKIPFEFMDRSPTLELYEFWQICVPDDEPIEDRIVSVIEGSGTYGHELNLLEIMGLLTDEELQNDSVVGYLTAENVFERIMKYYGS